ncbi:MAG: VPDSG-CTERM sorting domain-containing protein [Verrucomicrobiota bacterium]
MKKTILGLIAAATLLGNHSASAMLITDVDFGLPLAHLSASSNPSYSGTWDLRSGFDPSTQQLNWAIASFLIIDDFDIRSETYSISLDGSGFSSGNAAFAFVVGGVHGNTFMTLQQNGFLDYTVTATQGDFYLKQAGLVADVACGRTPTHVPDGGTTIGLLGAALIGLFGMGRKFAKA